VTVIESIIKNLETLPASKLVEVAHFISGLNPNRRNERIAARDPRLPDALVIECNLLTLLPSPKSVIFDFFERGFSR
jgi:hypothetical protein